MKKVFLILLSVGIFAQETEKQNYELIKYVSNIEGRKRHKRKESNSSNKS